MDIEAKIREDMKFLGCKSDTKIALAYSLYIHLAEDKLMYDTEYCFNKDIDTLYIVARPSKTDKINIYVPIATCDDICLDFINKLQENLCTVETGPSINLAFIDGDSATVIYSFSKGLTPRPNPDVQAQQKLRVLRRSHINNELNRNRHQILNNAVNGGAVDDDGEDCLILE